MQRRLVGKGRNLLTRTYIYLAVARKLCFFDNKWIIPKIFEQIRINLEISEIIYEHFRTFLKLLQKIDAQCFFPSTGGGAPPPPMSLSAPVGGWEVV